MIFAWPQHVLYKTVNDDDIILNFRGRVWIRGLTVVNWVGGSRSLLKKSILRNPRYKAPLGDVLQLPPGWESSPERNRNKAVFLSTSGLLLLLNETRNSSDLAMWLIDDVIPAAAEAYQKHLLLQLSKVVRDFVPQVRGHLNKGG